MFNGKLAINRENSVTRFGNSASATVIIINSRNENSIGLGRNLNLKLLNNNEAWLSKSITDYLEIDIKQSSLIISY